MVINFNVESMFSMNQSRLQGIVASRSVERLSSGLKINRGADDPSGLGIAATAKAQIRGIATAIHNCEESIALYTLRDAYLEEFDQMLNRMRELAVRAANEATLTSAELEKMNEEVTKLKNEINRTMMSSYEVDGGRLLFNPGDLDVIWVMDITGSMDPYATSLYNDSAAMFDEFKAAGFDLRMGVCGFDEDVETAIGGSLTFRSSATDFQADVDDLRDIILAGGITGTENGLAAIDWALNYGNLGGDFRADAQKIVILLTDEDTDDFYADPTNQSNWYDNYPLNPPPWGPPGPPATGPTPVRGSNDPTSHADPGNLKQATINNLIAKDAKLHAVGVVKVGSLNWVWNPILSRWGWDGTETETVLQNSPDSDYQEVATAVGVDGGIFSLDTGGNWVTSITGTMLASGGPWRVDFQVGPDSNHNLNIRFETVGTASLAVDGVDLTTVDSARKSIEIIDNGKSNLNDMRTNTANAVRRLGMALNDLSVEFINISAYKSNIEEADIAKEIVDMTINQLVSETTVAAQVQAQVSPQRALEFIDLVRNAERLDKFGEIFTVGEM